jgi:REP element-mobilizing transposase RayT
MSELKFRNKYRIPSNRLKNWDYGSNSAYFITICTKNREHFFGEINNGKMQLNELGKNAVQFWMEIPNHFPFIELGNFVVMPNHTHGILIIDKPVDNRAVDTPNVEMPNLGISTGCISTGLSTDIPQKPKPKNGGKIDEWKPGTIGVIVNQYKRMVTIHNRKINPNFAWQSNYHDHIIRNSKSFENIQNYIENNPAQWKEDRFC